MGMPVGCSRVCAQADTIIHHHGWHYHGMGAVGFALVQAIISSIMIRM